MWYCLYVLGTIRPLAKVASVLEEALAHGQRLLGIRKLKLVHVHRRCGQVTVDETAPIKSRLVVLDAGLVGTCLPLERSD